MKLEKTDIEVLKLMVKDIKKEYSIKQLAEQLGKTYVKVYNSIQRLGKKCVITKKVMGKSHYCNIDCKNNLDIVCFIEAQKARIFLSKNKSIAVFVDSINEKILSPDYVLVVFGSYADGKSTKNSDLDIALIIGDKSKAERVINAVARISPLKVHALEFTYNDLIEMLKAKEMNVGKEIAANHVILHGCEQFYECIRLAQ